MVPSGFESFCFNSALEGCFLFEQVQRYAVEQREVLCCVACSFSVQVFVEAHIEHPVQFVFDSPVLADDAYARQCKTRPQCAA